MGSIIKNNQKKHFHNEKNSSNHELFSNLIINAIDKNNEKKLNVNIF